MKRAILALAFALGLTAEESDWTKHNTTLEISYQVAAFADYLQTLQIVDNDSKFIEGNRIIYGKPSKFKVTTYFLLSGISHYAISKLLHGKYRLVFQYASLFYQIDFVRHNYSLGIKVKF